LQLEIAYMIVRVSKGRNFIKASAKYPEI